MVWVGSFQSPQPSSAILKLQFYEKYDVSPPQPPPTDDQSSSLPQGSLSLVRLRRQELSLTVRLKWLQGSVPSG